MRLTREHETIVVYDRILRLLSTIEITLDSDQKAVLSSWLKQEAAREPDSEVSVALRLMDQVVRAYE